MKNCEYFNNALVSFTSDVAYVGAVRHLYDSGLTVSEIKHNLSYPVSEDKIRKVIRDYEQEKQGGAAEYEYIQETDAYGRRSFRRVARVSMREDK